MNQTGRIVLCVLCGLLMLAAPFVISSPTMLSEVVTELTDRMDQEEGLDLFSDDEEDGEELDLGRLLFSRALAEEEEAPAEDDGDLTVETVEEAVSELGPAQWELPLDFSVPPAPKAENYTENGYADESIIVRMEDREEDGVIWHLAFIQIASSTQLRTATAGKLTSKKVASVSGMAKNFHAIVAINGDNYQSETEKKTFEYRMTEKVRSKTNKAKDMLITDENGDFHLVLAAPKAEQAAALEALAAEHQIVNAFTFGPALVIDSEEQQISTEYGFNPNRPEPRSAIGQTGRLSYVMAIAEGRGASSGVSIQNLAHFMAGLGCTQAFNLDGGNSAEMVFGETLYKGMPGGDERGLNDIIYFATAVPEE